MIRCEKVHSKKSLIASNANESPDSTIRRHSHNAIPLYPLCQLGYQDLLMQHAAKGRKGKLFHYTRAEHLHERFPILPISHLILPINTTKWTKRENLTSDNMWRDGASARLMQTASLDRFSATCQFSSRKICPTYLLFM